jgi:hypothetical protein
MGQRAGVRSGREVYLVPVAENAQTFRPRLDQISLVVAPQNEPRSISYRENKVVALLPDFLNLDVNVGFRQLIRGK